MASFDIVTIGAATQDFFLRSPRFEEKRDQYAPDGFDACVPLGAKIELQDLKTMTGGGATNAAVTFAHFGCKTACIARVGDDAGGKSVRAELVREHISPVLLQTDKKEQTATSMIVLAGSGHRSILTFRGASKNIKAKEIPWKTLKPSWFYITALAGRKDLLESLFTFASREKISVAWNPGKSDLELGLRALEPFLDHTSVLILNREEAALLAELAPRDLRSIISHLSIYPSRALVITDGERGAYVRAQGKTIFAPPLKAKRVNTTGAGDAFGSAFVASLVKGKSERIALQAGMLNATSVISHMGPKAGILSKWPNLLSLSRVKIRDF